MKKTYSVFRNEFGKDNACRSEKVDGIFEVENCALKYAKGLVEIERANTQSWLNHEFEVDSRYDDTAVKVVANVVPVVSGYGLLVGHRMTVSFVVQETTK